MRFVGFYPFSLFLPFFLPFSFPYILFHSLHFLPLHFLPLPSIPSTLLPFPLHSSFPLHFFFLSVTLSSFRFLSPLHSLPSDSFLRSTRYLYRGSPRPREASPLRGTHTLHKNKKKTALLRLGRRRLPRADHLRRMPCVLLASSTRFTCYLAAVACSACIEGCMHQRRVSRVLRRVLRVLGAHE